MKISETYDPTTHWIDWGADVLEATDIVARCGAVVYAYAERRWLSHSSDVCERVTCAACSALPEYGLRLLAQTDLEGKPQCTPELAQDVKSFHTTSIAEHLVAIDKVLANDSHSCE